MCFWESVVSDRNDLDRFFRVQSISNVCEYLVDLPIIKLVKFEFLFTVLRHSAHPQCVLEHLKFAHFQL